MMDMMPDLERGNCEEHSSKDSADKRLRDTHAQSTTRPSKRGQTVVVPSSTGGLSRVRAGGCRNYRGARVRVTVTSAGAASRKWAKRIGGCANRRGEESVGGRRGPGGNTTPGTACEGLGGDFVALFIAVLGDLGESRLEFLDGSDDVGGALETLSKVLDIGAGTEALVIGARTQC